MIKRLETLLKEHAKLMETAQSAYADKEKFIKSNYAGEFLKSQMQQLKVSHNATMEDAKTRCQKSVNEILTQLRSKVDNMASQIDTEALNKLNALRGIKLSAAELEGLAKANKGDYMAMRVLASLAEDNNLHMKYVSIDDLQSAITELENTSMDFVKTYNGGGAKTATYKQMLITIQPHPFENVQQLFDSSEISISQKPKAPLTEDQKTTVKSLFAGYEKNLDKRVLELKALNMPGEKLLSDYYESISAGE